MAEFFWFVLKSIEERPENGESQGEERPMSPFLSPTARISAPSSACTCPSPRGSQGGYPTEELPGPSVGLEGTCKGRSLPPPSLLPPPVFKLGQRSTGSLRAGPWNFLTCCPPGHMENEMGAGNPCRSLLVIWKRRNQIPRIREHWGVLHGGNCSRDVNDLESSF